MLVSCGSGGRSSDQWARSESVSRSPASRVRRRRRASRSAGGRRSARTARPRTPSVSRPVAESRTEMASGAAADAGHRRVVPADVGRPFHLMDQVDRHTRGNDGPRTSSVTCEAKRARCTATCPAELAPPTAKARCPFSAAAWRRRRRTPRLRAARQAGAHRGGDRSPGSHDGFARADFRRAGSPAGPRCAPRGHTGPDEHNLRAHQHCLFHGA